MEDKLVYGDIRFHWGAYVSDYRESVDIIHVKTIFGMSRAFAKPLVFDYEEVQEHRVAPNGPTMSLDMRSAKQLMQALWDAGIRPESGHGSGAEAEALRAHIKFVESVVDRTFKAIDHDQHARAFEHGVSVGRQQKE